MKILLIIFVSMGLVCCANNPSSEDSSTPQRGIASAPATVEHGVPDDQCMSDSEYNSFYHDFSPESLKNFKLSFPQEKFKLAPKHSVSQVIKGDFFNCQLEKVSGGEFTKTHTVAFDKSIVSAEVKSNIRYKSNGGSTYKPSYIFYLSEPIDGVKLRMICTTHNILEKDPEHSAAKVLNELDKMFDICMSYPQKSELQQEIEDEANGSAM